jgi:hypothetical protein
VKNDYKIAKAASALKMTNRGRFNGKNGELNRPVSYFCNICNKAN